MYNSYLNSWFYNDTNYVYCKEKHMKRISQLQRWPKLPTGISLFLCVCVESISNRRAKTTILLYATRTVGTAAWRSCGGTVWRICSNRQNNTTDRHGCRPRPPPGFPSRTARTGSANRGLNPASLSGNPMSRTMAASPKDRDCHLRTFAYIRRRCVTVAAAGAAGRRHQRWRWCSAIRPEVRIDRKPQTCHAASGHAPTGTATTVAS